MPLSQLWFTPGTLLSHDCLNSGFEGQSLRATHKAISGEGDASMRRWREGAKCGRASFLFRSWPTKLCSSPKAYSSNDLNFQQTEEMWPCWVTSDDIAGCENQQSCNLEEISREGEGGITFLKDLQRQGKTWWKYDHGGKDIILFQIRKVNKKQKLRRARLGRDKWLSYRKSGAKEEKKW